jgi:hypothetical protein
MSENERLSQQKVTDLEKQNQDLRTRVNELERQLVFAHNRDK